MSSDQKRRGRIGFSRMSLKDHRRSSRDFGTEGRLNTRGLEGDSTDEKQNETAKAALEVK